MPTQEVDFDPFAQPGKSQDFAEVIRTAGEKSDMNAVSPKGARSDMQTMPATAVDPGYGVVPAKDTSLEEAHRVGVDYANALKDKYGDETLASIGYNAGPGKLEQWLKQFGDPRTGAISMADFLAKIPYKETKDYAGRIQAARQGGEPSSGTVVPVDHDPFAGVEVKPVDGDPFSKKSKSLWEHLQDMMGGAQLPNPQAPYETVGGQAKKFIQNIPAMLEKPLAAMVENLGAPGDVPNAPGLTVTMPGMVRDTHVGGGAPVIEAAGQKMRQQAQQQLEKNAPNVPGASFQGFAQNVGQGAVELAPAFAAAAITKNPNVFIAGGATTAYGNTYADARQRGATPDQAEKEALVSAAASSIGFKLFEYSPFRHYQGTATNELTGEVANIYKQTVADTIKNLTMQGMAIQPAVSTVEHVTDNIINGKDPLDGLPGPFLKSGLVNTIMAGVGHIAARRQLTLGEWKVPQNEAYPYDPSAHFGQPPPIEPEGQGGGPRGPGPTGGAPAGRLAQQPPERGTAIGVQFPDGSVRRAEVLGYGSNGRTTHLRYEDGETAEHLTSEVMRDMRAPPAAHYQPESEVPKPFQRQLNPDEGKAPPFGEAPPEGPGKRAQAKIAGRQPQPVLDPQAIHALDLADRLERAAGDPGNPMSTQDRLAAMMQVARIRQQFQPEGEESRPGAYRHPAAGEPSADLGELGTARAIAPGNYQGQYERQPFAPSHVSRGTFDLAQPAYRPQDLLQFLGASGGLKSDDPYVAGNLQAMDAHKKFLPNSGMLVRKGGGMSMDYAREAAQEAGFGVGYNNFETTDDLLDAIRDSLAGKDVFSHTENGGIEAAQAWQQHKAALRIDPHAEETSRDNIEELRHKAEHFGIPVGEDWTAEDLMAAVGEREAVLAERAHDSHAETQHLADVHELNLDHHMAVNVPEGYGLLRGEGVADEDPFGHAEEPAQGQPATQPEAAAPVGEHGGEGTTGKETGTPGAGGRAGDSGAAEAARDETPAEPVEISSTEKAGNEGEKAGNEPPHRVGLAEENANPEPSQAQIEAGNYRHGHVTVEGVPVTIETASGSERRGVGPTGKPWKVTLQHPYGYVKRSEGADGEQVDVYVGPHHDSPDVFVVDQIDPKTGDFDEHKAILGVRSEEQARDIYNAGFSDGSGSERLGAITAMPVDEFRQWAESGPKLEPLAYREPIPEAPAIAPKDLGRQAADDMRAAKATPDVRADESADEVEDHIDEAIPAHVEEALEDEHWRPASETATEPQTAGRPVEAGEPVGPAGGEAEGRPAPHAVPTGGGHPAGEGAPARAGERPVDDDGKPIFKEGERVVIGGDGEFAGRHGTISNVTRMVTTTLFMNRGQRGEKTSHHYQVKTDEGAETYGHELTEETARPAKVVKDPVWLNHPITPDALRRTIEYAKKSVERHEDRAARARKKENIGAAKYAADQARQQAVDAQKVLDAWERQNPDQAKVPEAAIPPPPIAVSAPNLQSGITVKENPERNGVEVRFKERPTDEVLGKLKAAGFRWSKPQKLWYAKRSDRTLAVANSLKSGAEVAKPAEIRQEPPVSAPPRVHISRIDSGNHSGQYRARVMDGPHKDVIAIGNTVEQAGAEVQRAIAERENFTTTPGAIAAEHAAEVSSLEAQGMAAASPENKARAKAMSDFRDKLDRHGAVHSPKGTYRIVERGFGGQSSYAVEITEGGIRTIEGASDSEPRWSRDKAVQEAVDRAFKKAPGEPAAAPKGQTIDPEAIQALRREYPNAKDPEIANGLRAGPRDSLNFLWGWDRAKAGAPYGGFGASGERLGFDAYRHFKERQAATEPASQPQRFNPKRGDRVSFMAGKNGVPVKVTGTISDTYESDPTALVTLTEVHGRSSLKPGMTIRAPKDKMVPAVALTTRVGGGAPGTGWEEIGRNSIGQTLYEDHRGVRSYVENGIRYSEPVALNIGKPGVGFSTDRAAHPAFYLDSEVETPTQTATQTGAAEAARAEMDASVYQPAAMPITSADKPPKKPPAADLFSRGDAVQPKPENAADLPPRSGPRYVTDVSPDGKQVTLDGGAVLPSTNVEPISGHGLQEPIRPGAAGSGSKTVPRAGEDQQDRPVPAGKEPGGTRTVGNASRAGAQGTGRTPTRSPGAEIGRGAGDVPDAGLPAERPDANVRGENFVIEPGALAEDRGPKAKATGNLAAISLAKRLTSENRAATKDEQAILAKYVGWGGLSGAFQNSNGLYGVGLEDIGRELKAVLSPDEYRTASQSTQYAHYTAENVIRSMWDAVRAMGFDGGSVFEPGMGVGHFLGLMPPDVAAKSQYEGIELDHLTAEIAGHLYPRSGVRQADFIETPLPENTFDLVIGNPPFSDTIIQADPKYSARRFMLHDYFFAKSLDSVRPGGLLAFVTSAGTMNKISDNARIYLAQRAEFLGGVRLPSNAFKKNAGTEVTTDVLFFQKRPESPVELNAADARWLQTVQRDLPNAEGKTTTGNVSRYFSEHPEMVLGREGYFDKLYKDRYAVHAEDGADLTEGLARAMENLPKDVYRPPATPRDKAEMDFASNEKKDGSFYIKDGQLMQYDGGVGKPVLRRGAGVEGGVTAGDMEKIQRLIPIRDALRDVFSHDLAERKGEADVAREKLNRAYDAYTRKYGAINKAEFQYRRPNVIQQEYARAKAREDARELGEPWNEGTFDGDIEGKPLKEIARLRDDARTAHGAKFDEGSFDPAEMPDVVIEKRPNIDPFRDDQESYRIRAIEEYDDTTGASKKKRIFFEPVLTREQEPVINSANDGVLWSLNKLGRFDVDAIAQKTGRDRADIITELGDKVYKVPGTDGTYQTSDEYLSGDIMTKLDEARSAAQHDPDVRRNIAALEAAMPAPLSPADISMTFGMPWIPPQYLEEFLRDHLRIGEFRIRHSAALGGWSVNPISNGADNALWSVEDFGPTDLIKATLNRKPPRIMKEFHVQGEGRKTAFDPVATQAVQDKYDALRNSFQEWIAGEGNRADELAGIYNTALNRSVLRVYDGSYLTTPGVSKEWSWRPHQKRVVARIIQSGSTYMAHAVGAGKTSAMIGAGMEMKRLGLVNKPMYVVPNHMLGQFTKEFYEQYPTARIMVADERRFHTSRRKQFIANVAQADIDAVILTHSSFEMIPISGGFQKHIIQEELDYIEEALKSTDKKDDRFTVKRLENQKEKLQQKLKGAMGNRKDATNTFEELGVDFLFTDEAHEFRKLSFATNQSGMKGIDPKGAEASFDLYTKIRYLDSKRPGRSTVLASGTPVVNTMGELYSISRYLQRGELQDRGLGHFDSWASTFGDTKQDLEQTPDGNYKPVLRFSRFVNIPELYKMVGQVMDVVTPAQLEQYVVRPKLKGGKRNLDLAPKTDELVEYQEKLRRRMEAIKNRKGKLQKGDDILLSIIYDGRKAALDMRMVDPEAPNNPDSKLNRMIADIYKIYVETKDTQFYDPKTNYQTPTVRGPATQMVFADSGVHPKEGRFHSYGWIKRELLRLGVNPSELAFIKDYKSHVAKQKLFNDMNTGKVRILIGSVDLMGTGVNAQKRLIKLHNEDPYWFPGKDIQRVGRILRQGNMNPEIEIQDYSTKGTYDATMWQMMGRKARFIEQFFRGDPELRDMEDFGEASQYEQASAMSTADPRVMELTEKRQDLDKALRRESAHDRAQYTMRQQLKQAHEEIADVERRLPVIRADVAKRKLPPEDEFKLAVAGKVYTKESEAVEAARAIINEKWPTLPEGDSIPLGEYAGFQFAVRKQPGSITTYKGSPLFYFRRSNGAASELSGETPTGAIRSIQKRVAGFENEVEYLERRKSDSDVKIKSLESQIGKPFTGGEEITRLRQEVKDLEAALTPKKELSVADIDKQIEANQAAFNTGDLTDDEFIQRDTELRSLKQQKSGPQAGGIKAQRPKADQTKTPEFQRWFGGSKVADKAGQPLVVYHGTAHGPEDQPISEFHGQHDPERQYTGLMNVTGIGSFFTESPEIAETFPPTIRASYDPSVTYYQSRAIYPVYLSIKNPKKYATIGQVAEDMMGKIGGPRPGHFSPGDQYGFVERLMAEGYDGITFMEAKSYRPTERANKARVWVTFDPAQVKSATGNTGAFDPNNPDIRAQRPREGVANDEAGIPHISNERYFAEVRRLQGDIDAARRVYENARLVSRAKKSPENSARRIAARHALNDAEVALHLYQHRAGSQLHDYAGLKAQAAAPFFSALTRSVEAINQVKAPAAQWSGIIDNLKGKGVKEEEIQWSGVKEWLAEQKGPVTKADLVQFLRDNEIQIKEVMHGGPTADQDLPAPGSMGDQRHQELSEKVENDEELTPSEDKMYRWLLDHPEASDLEFLTREYDLWREENDIPAMSADEARMALVNDVQEGERPAVKTQPLIDWLKDFEERWTDAQAVEHFGRTEIPTRFKAYTLPGGENYRELLLTLPAMKSETVGAWLATLPGDGEQRLVGTFGEMQRLRDEGWKITEAPNERAPAFHSQHWEEPNILAHIRFDDRTGPNGDKILHVAEIQSDWHQRGRRAGYTNANIEKAIDSSAKIDDLDAALVPIMDMLGIEDGGVAGQFFSGDEGRNWETAAHSGRVEALREWLRAENAYEQGAVPDAPFKTTWPELAFKRMLRYAVENGYDVMSWDTGETNADRYDLSKTISEVTLHDNNSGGIARPQMHGPFKEGNLHAYDLNGREVIRQYVRSPEEIVDLVGKDVAEKLLNATPTEARSAGLGVRQRSLKGLALRVGGEGMHGFYDKILPDFARKYVKRWDGKVEDVPLSGAGGYVRLNDDGSWTIQFPGRSRTQGVAPGKSKAEMIDWVMENYGWEVNPRTLAIEGTAGTSAHSIRITPAMRDSVMAGQPLFQRNLATIWGDIGGTKRLAPDFYARMPRIPSEGEAQLIEQINRIAKQIVPGATVIPAKELIYRGDKIWGAVYPDGGRSIIAWALEGPDPHEAIRHEAIHWLRNVGFFSPGEWDALGSAAINNRWLDKHLIRERYAGEDFATQIEEAIAEEYAAWARRETTPPPQIRTLFGRIREMLGRAAKYLRSLFGKDVTAEDIFKKVMSGEIGSREPNDKWKPRPEVFAQASKTPESPPETVAEGRDYIDATTKDLAEHMRSQGPGTYERTLKNLQAPSGPELFHRANFLQRAVAGPRTVAELDTKSGRFWAAIQREEDEAGQRLHGLRDDISKNFLKLPRERQDRVNAVMEVDRLEGRTRTDDGRSIIARNEKWADARGSKPGEEIILTPEETKAYFGLQRMYRQAWDNIMEGSARRMGWGSGDIKRPWSPAMSDNLRAIQKAIDTADNQRNRKAFQRIHDVLSAMEEQRRQAYMPLMRFGDYYFSVTPKVDRDSTGGFPESQWFSLAERPSMTFADLNPINLFGFETTQQGQVPEYAKKELAQLQARFDPKEFRINHGYLLNKPDALRQMSIPAIEKLMMLLESGVMDRLKTEASMEGSANKGAAYKKAKEDWGNLYEELVDAVRDEMYEQLKAGFKKRARTVPGYSGDWNRVLGSYMGWTSKHVSKQIHGDTIERLYDDIQNNHPHQPTRDFWLKWKQADDSPMDPLSRVGVGLNQIGFLWTMAINPASTVSIMMHGPTYAIPTLGTGIGTPKAAAAFARAYGEATMAVTWTNHGVEINIGKVGKTQDERHFLKGMEASGYLHAKGADDIRSMAEKASAIWGEYSPHAKQAMDIASSNIAVADQANRVAVALSAYRLARDGNLGRMNAVWGGNQMWRAISQEENVSPESMAKFMLNQAVGEWGGRSRSAAGRHWMGRLTTALKGFIIRFLSNMFKQMARQGSPGRMALGYSLAGLWAAAGLEGLPFVGDAENLLDEVWKVLTGHDPMLSWRLRALLADTALGKYGAEMVLHGPLSSLTGVDFHSRLSLGDVITKDVAPFVGAAEESALTIVSIMAGSARAFKLRSHSHQPASAAVSLLPNAIRHPAQAVIDAEKGVKSQSGKRTYVPARKFTAFDEAAEAAGFSPLDVSRAREHTEFRYRAAHTHGSRPKDMVPR